MIKTKGAKLLPLGCKHYSTEVEVVAEVDGKDYTFYVSISGYAPNASYREVMAGWEPDWGMDHTESEAHLHIAERIIGALTTEGECDA